MTGPIGFNLFKGISGTDKLPDIDDRRETLRPPDIDTKIPDFSMNVGEDQEGEIDWTAMDPEKMKKDS